MASPTQQVLGAADVAALVRHALGVDVVACAALTGGEFAAVWRADLADGRAVALKVGPPPGVGLLAYEAGMIAAEEEYLRLVADGAPDVPVPRVLAQGTSGVGPVPVAGDWVLTTFLPGTPLPDLAASGHDTAEVRHDVGAALAAVHRITGDRFGYTGDRPHGSTWREALIAIVESLLADAAAWGVGDDLLPAARVRAAFDRHAGALDDVARPVLVHVDLWDGNVLALPGADGTWRLSGLVDGERHLFGDPLVDLVSPVMFRSIEDEPDHPLLDGYVRAAGRPVVLDTAARTRLALYRVWIDVVMTAELPSRGKTGPDDAGFRDLLSRHLTGELARLGV
jgi:aminoglycoside phosphotransferase (APT) family kinase protein